MTRKLLEAGDDDDDDDDAEEEGEDEEGERRKFVKCSCQGSPLRKRT